MTEAVGVIEGWRETYASHDNVSWQDDEVDARGLLYGLAPKGVVYCISCVPPLDEPLNHDDE